MTKCPNCDSPMDPSVEECQACGWSKESEEPKTGNRFDQPTIVKTGGGDSPAADTTSTDRRTVGDYEILDEIARGGMGVVYRAKQRGLDREVALKMILQGSFAGKEDTERFSVEARAAAKLDHPGIVPIYDFGQIDGRPYYSMALVEGESLSDLTERGPLPNRQAAELALAISNAIAYAHEQGVLHRDLKPANILLDRDGLPRVTDFGLAKQLDSESQLTMTGQTLGTPGFMPPEQAGRKPEDVGPASDVYAIGAILYCMLAGQPPFQGETLLELLNQVMERQPTPPSQLINTIPTDIETICLKCLEKDPKDRYASATELSDELQRFLDGKPIQARPLSFFETVKRWRQIISQNNNVRLTTSRKLFGLPIAQVCFGRDPVAGEDTGHAKAIFAYGDRATGVIAVGGKVKGVIAIGQYALGVVSWGLCSAGLFTAGAVSLGVFAAGGVAFGYVAFGMVAIGYHAIGMVAGGINAFGNFLIGGGR